MTYARFSWRSKSREDSGDNFKKHEMRYGFNGGKRPKHKAWDGKAEGEIEVDIDPHFNPESKYWLEYYNKNQIAYGPAYIEYMNLATCSVFSKQIIRIIRYQMGEDIL